MSLSLTPEFIQELHALYQEESRPYNKVFRFLDLTEAVLKYHTSVIVSNYLNIQEENLTTSEQKDRFREGKSILGTGLARPSLGLWAFFTEKLGELIPGERLFWSDFPEFFESVLKPISAELIPLRNKYHHGPVPSNETCIQDLEKHEILLAKLWKENTPLTRGRLVLGEVLADSNSTEVILQTPDGNSLNLSPILLFQNDLFFYYNDARKFDKSSFATINYARSEHRSNEEIFEEFRRVFPLTDWQKAGGRFQARIEELTENFQGRYEQLNEIRNFLVSRDSGYHFVWGGPGIGKSAFLARSLVLARAGAEEKNQYTEKSFDLGSSQLILLEYFIRRNTITDKLDTFFEMMGQDLEKVFKTVVGIGSTTPEKQENWWKRLHEIESKLNENKKDLKDKKLVIIIDGLDEGSPDILRFIPREIHSRILFLLAGRPTDDLKKLYSECNPSLKFELTLGGLKPEDIAAILRSVGNSDSLTKEYIDTVTAQSEGNPLYLKILTDSILSGERKIGETQNLPQGVESLYGGILERIQKSSQAKGVFRLLALLTQAKDFLTPDTMCYLLDEKYFVVQNYLDVAKEVLWENPLTEDIEDYQLFHESLRDYFTKNYQDLILQVESKLLERCRTWKSLWKEDLNPTTLRYILTYFITHLHTKAIREQDPNQEYPRTLSENPTKTEIVQLTQDPEYRKAQLEALNFYDIPMSDAVIALETAILDTAGDWGMAVELDKIMESGNLLDCLKLIRHAGETGHSAQTDISIAFTWAEEGRVEDAVNRVLVIQDEKKLLEALCLIAWILADREGISDEQKKKDCDYVLDVLDKKCRVGVVEWGEWDPLPRYSLISTTCFTEKSIILVNRSNNAVKNILIKELLNDDLVSIAEKIIIHYSREIINFENDLVVKELFSVSREVFCVKYNINIFNYLLSLLGYVEDLDEKKNLIKKLIQCIKRDGDSGLKLEMFSKIIELAIDIDASELFQEVMVILNTEEDFIFANSTINKLDSEYDKYRALAGFIEALTSTSSITNKESFIDKVKKLANKIKDPTLHSSILAEFAKFYYFNDNLKEAENLLKEAQIFLNNIELIYHQVLVLLEIAVIYFNNSDKDRSKLLINKAHDLFLELDAIDEKIISLPRIIEAYISVGDCRSAQEIIDNNFEVVYLELDDEESKLDFLIKIIESLSGDLADDVKINFINHILDLTSELDYDENKIDVMMKILESSTKDINSKFNWEIFPIVILRLSVLDYFDVSSEFIFRINEIIKNLSDTELKLELYDIIIIYAKENVSDELDKSKIIVIIVKALVEIDDFMKVLLRLVKCIDLINEIEKIECKAGVLEEIFITITRFKNLNLDSTFFIQLQNIASDIEEDKYKAFVFREMAKLFYYKDEPEISKHLFNQSLNLSLAIEDYEVRGAGVKGLAVAFKSIGDAIYGKKLFVQYLTMEDKRNQLSIKMTYNYALKEKLKGKYLADFKHDSHNFNLFVEHALSCITKKNSSLTNYIHLESIIEFINTVGDSESIEIVINEIINRGRKLKDKYYRSSILLLIAKTIMNKRNNEEILLESLKNAIKIKKGAYRDRILLDIVEFAVHSLEENLQQEFLEIAFKSLEETKNINIKAELFEIIIKSLWKFKYIEDYISHFSFLFNVAINSEDDGQESKNQDSLFIIRRGIYGALTGVSDRGDINLVVNNAIKATDELDYDLYQVIALVKIIEALRIAREPALAIDLLKFPLKVAEKIDDSIDQSKAFRILALEMINLDEFKLAKNILSKAKQTSDKIFAFSKWAYASELSEIAELFKKAGDTKQANLIFITAEKIIKEVENDFEKAAALETLSKSYFGANKISEAKDSLTQVFNLINHIDDDWGKGKMIPSITKQLLQLVDLDEVLNVLNTFDNINDKELGFESVSIYLAKSMQKNYWILWEEKRKELDGWSSRLGIKWKIGYSSNLLEINSEKKSIEKFVFSYFLRSMILLPFEFPYNSNNLQILLDRLAESKIEGKNYIKESFELSKGLGLLEKT